MNSTIFTFTIILMGVGVYIWYVINQKSQRKFNDKKSPNGKIVVRDAVVLNPKSRIYYVETEDKTVLLYEGEKGVAMDVLGSKIRFEDFAEKEDVDENTKTDE